MCLFTHTFFEKGKTKVSWFISNFWLYEQEKKKGYMKKKRKKKGNQNCVLHTKPVSRREKKKEALGRNFCNDYDSNIIKKRKWQMGEKKRGRPPRLALII